MEKNTEKKSTNIRLIMQIMIASVLCAALFFSRGKNEFPYSEVNKYSSYLFFHNSDIRGRYNKIIEMIKGILPENTINEKDDESGTDNDIIDENSEDNFTADSGNRTDNDSENGMKNVNTPENGIDENGGDYDN